MSLSPPPGGAAAAGCDDGCSLGAPVSGAVGADAGAGGGGSYLTATDTGLRLRPGSRVLCDEAAGLMHEVVGNVVFSTPLRAEAAAGAPQRMSHAVGEGPPVLLVAMSPDWAMLALQRSHEHVEVMDCSTGNILVQGPSAKRGSNAVRGFVWVTCPDADCVLVTVAGLELYKRPSTRGGGGGGGGGQCLQFVEARPLLVKWWRYSHATRVLLLGTGDGGNKLQAVQFTSREVLRLPAFEPPGGPGPDPHAPPRPLWLLLLYGRVYVAVLGGDDRRLLLFRLYRDSVLLQHQFTVPPGAAGVAVVDNVLLLHHPAAAATTLLDVCHAAPAPLAPPAPLELQACGGGGGDDEGCAYGPYWRYMTPDLAVDVERGRVYRIAIRLPQLVAAAAADPPALVAFLQRRSAMQPHDPDAHPKALTLRVLKASLSERLPLRGVRTAFDATVAALAEAGGGDTPGQAAGGVGAGAGAVISAQEMQACVLQWLADEEVVDAQYLGAAVSAYAAALAAAGLPLPAATGRLWVDALLQQGGEYQVGQLLGSLPSLDSAPLAQHLLVLYRRGALPQGLQLALDMLRRLEAYRMYCDVLLEYN